MAILFVFVLSFENFDFRDRFMELNNFFSYSVDNDDDVYKIIGFFQAKFEFFNENPNSIINIHRVVMLDLICENLNAYFDNPK